jgi:DNA-binding transcriptional regulator GbsR (MarR family)
MEQVTGSYLPVSERQRGNQGLRLSSVEASFIENWGALARSFGMDTVLGRVHALAFLSTEPVSATQVCETLSLRADETERCLESLERWGAVRGLPESECDDEPLYAANGDPWSWFVATLKERGKREFSPLLQGFREANARAQELRNTLPPGARAEVQRIDRIARFSEFVDQIASLLETFATLGAGPMMTAMRMVAKMRSPRLARI